MYTRVAPWATFAIPLPMWGVEGSEMDLLPNMVTDFRDTAGPQRAGQWHIEQEILAELLGYKERLNCRLVCFSVAIIIIHTWG
jgi:hypothetical protein